MVTIPANIKRHITMIEEGKKITKKVSKEKQYSKTQLLSMALKNLEFLNEIAKNETTYSFLEKDHIILVLNNFSTGWDPTQNMVSLGVLCLAKKKEQIGLFFWFDADFPANRSSDRDYTLVTQEDLNHWHEKSLEIFAKLTEKKIWRNMDQWLKL